MNMSEEGSYVGEEVWYNGTYVYPVLYLMKPKFLSLRRFTEVDFEYQYIPVHDEVLKYVKHQASRYEYGISFFDPLDSLWRVFYESDEADEFISRCKDPQRMKALLRARHIK